MALMELEDLYPLVETIEEDLKILLLPPDPHDDKNVIVEIKGQLVGMKVIYLQATYLKECIQNFQKIKNGKIRNLKYQWKVQMGGFASLEFMISGGDLVYSTMKYESGCTPCSTCALKLNLRVEFIPQQHSTCNCLKAEEVEMNVSWNDIPF